MKNEVTNPGEAPVDTEHVYERMTFFRSFQDAINLLGSRKRLLAYEAIFDYGLNAVRREDLPKEVETILRMAIPQINASHRRQREGMKGKQYGVLGLAYGSRGGRPPQEDELTELDEFGEFEKPTNYENH
jgi:hypothetical protein